MIKSGGLYTTRANSKKKDLVNVIVSDDDFSVLANVRNVKKKNLAAENLQVKMLEKQGSPNDDTMNTSGGGMMKAGGDMMIASGAIVMGGGGAVTGDGREQGCEFGNIPKLHRGVNEQSNAITTDPTIMGAVTTDKMESQSNSLATANKISATGGIQIEKGLCTGNGLEVIMGLQGSMVETNPGGGVNGAQISNVGLLEKAQYGIQMDQKKGNGLPPQQVREQTDEAESGNNLVNTTEQKEIDRNAWDEL